MEQSASHLPFRPPIHRKHEKCHSNARSPRPSKRQSTRLHGDVALHVMGGSDADMTSLRQAISPQYNRARGDCSAESTLSRGTASASSSLRSKSSSLNKRRAANKIPPAMEGDVFESSVYEAPVAAGPTPVACDSALASAPLSRRHNSRSSMRSCQNEQQVHVMSSAILEEASPGTSQHNTNTAASLRDTAASCEHLVSQPVVDALQHADNAELIYTHPNNLSSNRHTVTLSGTIKRGQKQDQVNVTLSAHEIAVLNKYTARDEKEEQKAASKCSSTSGPHVFFCSLLYMPLAFVFSLFLSFYTGSLCWYNIYIYLSEECSVFHKLFLCPLLIIAYPLYILLTSLFIAFYAMFVQISWFCVKWQREIRDLDKNFYGAMCNIIGLPQCSPYEIIVLEDNMQSVESDDVVNRKI